MHSIHKIQELSKEELLGLWNRLPGKAQPPPFRADRLLKELAYRLQEQEHGRLDKNTSVSLKRHMADFGKSLLNQQPLRTAKVSSRLKLQPGTVISRHWNGNEIVVHVIHEREFLYEGKKYKSLSKVARDITGQHLSGPMFFGMKGGA